MGDGISHAYREARAASRFEDIYEKSIAEFILLKWEEKNSSKGVGELMEDLIAAIPTFSVRSYDTWDSFSGTRRVCEINLEVNRICRRFTRSSIKNCLKDALLFLEWAKTEEGIEACKDYYEA